MNNNQGPQDIKNNKQNLNSNTTKSPQTAPGVDRDLGQRQGDSSSKGALGNDKKRADWEGMGQKQSDKVKTPSKF